MGLIRDNALSRGATMGATKGVVGAAGLSNVGALGAKINRPLDTAAEAKRSRSIAEDVEKKCS
jgi:hypothetical protein